MSMTDPIADMLARIRNGYQARVFNIESPFSNIREGILNVLKQEGYISDFKKEKNESGKDSLKIELKYVDGEAAIKELRRVSKPGRRVYSQIDKLQKFYNGLGIAILSTSKGVLSDYDARSQHIGGEVLCYVF